MIQKKDFLLHKMIQEYIKCQEPIGSESLRISLGVKISSATIRNYFKILGDEGVIMQTHISSGRIPTPMALRNFWRENLNPSELNPRIDSQKIAQTCMDFQVTCAVRPIVCQKLLEVIELDDKALVLVFEHDRVALPMVSNMARFSQELIGLEIDDIKKIARDVCARSLLSALENLDSAPRIHFFGVEFLSDLLAEQSSVALDILQGGMFDELENSISFPNQSDYIIIAHNASFQNNPSKMICVGRLERDYEGFYQKIA